MHRVRFRVVLAAVVATLVMVAIWSWESRAWGVAYRPWDAEAAREVEQTMRTVQRGDDNDRMNAQRVLMSAGPGAARPLLIYLQDEDYRLRRLAVTVLGHVGDWSVVDPLVQRLDDPHPQVRKASVLALHRIARSEAAKALRGHADDSDVATRAAIAVALGDLSAQGNMEILVHMLQDGETPVRQMAAVSLGQLGDARAVPALVACLNDPARRTRLAATRSLSMCTGLPAHNDGNLWLAWWAVNREH